MTRQHYRMICAVHTPFHADGSVRYELVSSQARALVEANVTGCFVCGTTGESTSLTLDERRRIAQHWVDASGDSLEVVVHVGSLCLQDAQSLAAHAQQIGAKAIAAMPPCFLKPRRLEDLVDFCAELASAAPQLPFYYYHIPSFTGVTYSMVDFLRLAGERIDTLAGAKFTHSDLHDFGRCLDLDNGRWEMLFGLDEMLLGALALGARGGVGGTYALAPKLYQRIVQAYHQGDLPTAQQAQAVSREMISVLVESGGLPALKAMMKMLGMDCGPVRLPLKDLTDQEFQLLRCRLDELGVLEKAAEN